MSRTSSITSRTSSCYGRTELACKYFPQVCPITAWRKLKSLMADYPDLEPLTRLSRRIFTPLEAGRIFNTLGLPATPGKHTDD